jgi:hypothetical protein
LDGHFILPVREAGMFDWSIIVKTGAIALRLAGLDDETAAAR